MNSYIYSIYNSHILVKLLGSYRRLSALFLFWLFFFSPGKFSKKSSLSFWPLRYFLTASSISFFSFCLFWITSIWTYIKKLISCKQSYAAMVRLSEAKIHVLSKRGTFKAIKEGIFLDIFITQINSIIQHFDAFLLCHLHFLIT